MVQRLTEEADVVTISYDELLDGSCDLHRIEQAFGADSLGFLTVSGIPGLLELRNRMLLLAQEFADLPDAVKRGTRIFGEGLQERPSIILDTTWESLLRISSALLQDLPDEVKRTYEDPRGGAASVGWTRGAESLEDGRPDLNKGSYYANPLMDSVTTDPALLKRFPSYTTPNVDWPDTHLPDFRPTFQKLGRLILEVGLLLARQCDRYVASRLPSFPQGHLEGVLARSLNPKGRLLHYYPSQPDEVKAGHWCTQHTDHGSLTGLLSALYTRDGREVRNPDPTSGLYITGRGGASIKAPIPPSHLAFQVGEAMQVHSGGLLRATPHFVQTAGGPNAAGVARNTLAVFLQPRWDEAMDLPAGTDASTVGIGQWQEGITFGEFSELTVRKNYSKPE